MGIRVSATAVLAGAAVGSVVFLSWLPGGADAFREATPPALSAVHPGSPLVLPGEGVDLELITSCAWTNENEAGAPLEETCSLDATMWFREGRDTLVSEGHIMLYVSNYDGDQYANAIEARSDSYGVVTSDRWSISSSLYHATRRAGWTADCYPQCQ